jgi:hypothetical protein
LHKRRSKRWLKQDMVNVVEDHGVPVQPQQFAKLDQMKNSELVEGHAFMKRHRLASTSHERGETIPIRRGAALTPKMRPAAWYVRPIRVWYRVHDFVADAHALPGLRGARQWK